MSKTPKYISPGSRLASLRKSKKISFEQLSEATGLSAQHLQNIEEGNDFAPVGDILKISRILTIDPDILLNRENLKERKHSRKRDMKKREESYQYTLLSPELNKSHLRAFQVFIPARSEHPKINYQHEGEEFVFVLKGGVEITVGQNIHSLKKGDSLHFNSGIKHSLRNPGTKKTELLVTIYSP